MNVEKSNEHELLLPNENCVVGGRPLSLSTTMQTTFVLFNQSKIAFHSQNKSTTNETNEKQTHFAVSQRKKRNKRGEKVENELFSVQFLPLKRNSGK